MTYTELKKIEAITEAINSLRTLNIIEAPVYPVWNSESKTLSFGLYSLKPNHGIELAKEMLQVLDPAVEITSNNSRLNVTIHL